MKNDNVIKKYLWAFIAFTFIIKLYLAYSLELGNDEVYYWTYALFPDFSHYDHPPMIGYFIQLFTFNLSLDSELALRLCSVVTSTANIYIMYRIGKAIGNELTGFYSAAMFSASFYCSIIAGTFILPDTPQLVFWLIATYYLIKTFKDHSILKPNRNSMLWFGAFTGLALLSKYTSAYLWVGCVGYILLFDRRWLRTKEFYLSVLISILLFVPVIYWNYINDFVSIKFQTARVGVSGQTINIQYFITELLGQIFYNNPINVVIIVLAVVYVIKHKAAMNQPDKRILLILSVPLILLFLMFSLFRKTLPHWTGPSYTLLILIAAVYLQAKTKRIMSAPIIVSLLFYVVVIVLLMLQINIGMINLGKQSTDSKSLGSNDVTLDIYGWKQFAQKFESVYHKDIANKTMPVNASVITHKWFNTAHTDYYLRNIQGIKVYSFGTIDDMHRYNIINLNRGKISLGTDVYYISPTRDFNNASDMFANYFEQIDKPDSINIIRNGKTIEYFYIYRMRKLKTDSIIFPLK